MDHLRNHEEDVRLVRVALGVVLVIFTVALLIASLGSMTRSGYSSRWQPLYCSQSEIQVDSHCAEVCQMRADSPTIDAGCWVSCQGACGY